MATKNKTTTRTKEGHGESYRELERVSVRCKYLVVISGKALGIYSSYDMRMHSAIVILEARHWHSNRWAAKQIPLTYWENKTARVSALDFAELKYRLWNVDHKGYVTETISTHLFSWQKKWEMKMEGKQKFYIKIFLPQSSELEKGSRV